MGTEAEIGKEIAEIGKWSSTFVALIHLLRMRDLFGAKARNGIASVSFSLA